MTPRRYRACAITPGAQPDQPWRHGWLATCPCGWREWHYHQSYLREQITLHRLGRGADAAPCEVGTDA